MSLEYYPTVKLPKVYISASRVRTCVRSPCNAFPGRFLRSGGISDIMHGIYYLLFIIYTYHLFCSFFFYFSFFFLSNIHSNPCYHWARTSQIQSRQLMGSVQEGGKYVNIDAVPKRSRVGNMMKTATYYSVLVQSLSIAARYRRR
ncbi:hypothetical protein BDV36DRAFT_263377 [Aspergillus pseudocaelatus]|uniref:Uncharacterized protein n=1 Tax=Aspergillus pseudocaelatus TaxID=1825620 RepID=A0ABQ6WDB0_9EURO|nr:hypothetical protein BDV36DRAFT_263377 [Aspergillus pseudocaelatus]